MGAGSLFNVWGGASVSQGERVGAKSRSNIIKYIYKFFFLYNL